MHQIQSLFTVIACSDRSSKNARYHSKTKCINVKFNFIRNWSEEVTLEYIPMEQMVADPLTKSLDSSLFLSHVRVLGLRRW